MANKLKPECRSNHKTASKTDNCVPFGYDANGWPLGVLCSGSGCGAFICSHKKHSKVIRKGKSVTRLCRTCSEGT